MANPLTNVLIRRAQAPDVERLEALDSQTEWDWKAVISAGKSFTYLAEDDAPFGFVTAGQGQVNGLFITPSHRGHGMGKKLLVRGLSILKLSGCPEAKVWLPADSPVVRLFEGLDFKLDGSERLTNGHGVTQLDYGYALSLAEYF